MHWYSNGLFSQLVFFMLFSFFLAAFNFMLTRIVPSLRNWSGYWLILLLTAFIAMIPFAFDYKNLPDTFLAEVGSPIHIVVNIVEPLLAENNRVTFDVRYFILLVLILGSILGLARFFVSNWRVQKLINRARRLDSFDMLSQSQKKYISRKAIRIYITSEHMSSFVWGLFRPCLIFSEGVFSLPKNQFQLLVDHELTHIQRNDQRWVMVCRLCSLLFWFNPLISYIEKKFVSAMELNCDAQVLRQSPRLKKEYALALIASLKMSIASSERNSTVYFSDKRSSKNDFETRIRQAMSIQSNPHYGYVYKTLLFVCFVCIFSLSAFAQGALGWLDKPINLYDGLLPVTQSRVSSAYGEINNIRKNKPHNGIDFAAPRGTPVTASSEGEVMIAGDISLRKSLGTTILIRYNNIQTVYAHLDSVNVNVGDYVYSGQPIGTVGETGKATGPHLHFELIRDGKHIDPAPYLK